MDSELNDWRIEKRRKIESFFVEANRLSGSHCEIQSPSKSFSLAVDVYSTGAKTWRYSRGIVSQVGTSKIIADIKRNYGHFWHCWVRHPNGKEYLLCGEDYQGYTVIDLTDGDVKTYLPDRAKNGNGFCWAQVYPAPSATILAVNGCYWACPYDVIFYDFSEPSMLPLPEIGRIKETGKITGWETDAIFATEQEFIARKSDGKRLEALSEMEQEEYYNDEKFFYSGIEVVRWNTTTRSFVP